VSDFVPGQDQLATFIEGHTDDEINAAVAERGVDPLLDQVFAGMASRFRPERAAGQSAVVQWDVSTPEGTRSYQLRIADGACEARPGADEQARVTLGMALPDFLRFVAGKLDGMQAFMTGKLRLSGDMMFAQTMASWFR
jgi:putative sterol carrier protein